MRIAVIGGGPVGIFFTSLCLEKGYSVTLIDSGNLDSESSLLSKKNYVFKSPSALPDGVHKIGGGSTLWRARISEFQESDFFSSNNSGEATWPFKKQELSAHYLKLYKILNAGEVTDKDIISSYFAEERKKLPEEYDLRSYRFCQPNFFTELFKKIKSNQKLEILTGHFCIKIYKESESNDIYTELLPKNFAPIIRQFNKVVIACGALQTTALLQRSSDLLPDSASSVLGNFLMEHREGYIGNLVASKKTEKDLFKKLSLDNENRAINEFNGIGMAIANSSQLSANLLNIHYEIRNFTPRFYFRKILNQNTEINKSKIITILITPLSYIEKYSTYILRKLRKFYDNYRKIDRYSIYIKAEELAYKNSKVYLENKSENLLTYEHKVSYQVYSYIIEDIMKFKNVFLKNFSSKIKFYNGVTDIAKINKFFGPNWHPMGTTRMGLNQQLSICDENLEIYGAKNCFILSASVFPSGSNSNPTFTTLALASRLSESRNFEI